MLLVRHARNYKLLSVMTPFYLLLCCATVYIQAHYLVDAWQGSLPLRLSISLFYMPRAAWCARKDSRTVLRQKTAATLMLQQPCLPADTAGISRQTAITAYNAVAGNNKADRIVPHRASYGLSSHA